MAVTFIWAFCAVIVGLTRLLGTPTSRCQSINRDYRRPYNHECTLRSFSPAYEKIHLASRDGEPLFGREGGTTVSRATWNTNRLMGFRLGDEGRFRGNHRRTANCRATRRKTRDGGKISVWAEVFARRSIARGGSVGLTRTMEFVQSRRAKITFIRSSLLIFKVAKLYFFHVPFLPFVLYIRRYFYIFAGHLRCSSLEDVDENGDRDM